MAEDETFDAEDIEDLTEVEVDDIDEDEIAEDVIDPDDDVALIDEDEDDETPAPKKAAEDEEDEDEPDPDDVEEDLDTILRDRLSDGDDDDDEEDDDDGKVIEVTKAAAKVAAKGEADSDVLPKQEGEWTCMSCFLIVTKSAASASVCPHCGADRE